MESNALLYHAYMNCLTNSFGMPISSILIALLMVSTSSKNVSLMMSLSLRKRSHMKQYQGNRETVPERQYSSRPGTGECSEHPIQLLFRYAQIFGIIFYEHVQLTCYHLESQLTIATHHLPCPYDIKGSRSCSVLFTSSHPSLNLLHHPKTRVCDKVFYQYTC